LVARLHDGGEDVGFLDVHALDAGLSVRAAKRQAAAAGASEVFMAEDGFITEGGSSTVFIITVDGRIVMRPLSNAVLPGITRLAVMRLAAEEGLTLDEQAIRVEDACLAAEVFFTSASNFVVPVVSINGRSIGDGRPGPRTARLRSLYVAAAGPGVRCGPPARRSPVAGRPDMARSDWPALVIPTAPPLLMAVVRSSAELRL